MRPAWKEIKKCSRFPFEIIFFGVFFGQVWGNLGKNPLYTQKFASSYTNAFHQKVDIIDQHVPRGNLPETLPKARNLTQALSNNNLLLKGARSTCSAMQFQTDCRVRTAQPYLDQVVANAFAFASTVFSTRRWPAQNWSVFVTSQFLMPDVRLEWKEVVKMRMQYGKRITDARL